VVVEFVKIALNSVKERMMIMSNRIPPTSEIISPKVSCQSRVKKYASSVGLESKHHIRDMVECICKSPNDNPPKHVFNACQAFLLQTNKNGELFGVSSEK